MQLESDYHDWLAGQGRYGDTMLAHVTPEEAELLESLGGSGTINPETGLREFGGLWSLLFGDGDGGGLFNKIVSKASDVLKKTGESLGAIATNILKNPLPVIATIGLAMAGVPPTLSAAAISAIQGGSPKDIALAAVGAYAGQQIATAFSPAATATVYDVDFATGEIAQQTIAADTNSIVKQMVVSGSKDAAIALAQTGDLNKALTAGATGAVKGIVTEGLIKAGYDPKALPATMLTNISSNALTAVANGKSVSDAIAQGVVSSGLGNAISSAAGQQVSASLLLKTAKDVALADRKKADEFYASSILSRPQEIAAANAGIQKLSGLMDTANYNRGLLASAARQTMNQMAEESRIKGGALTIAQLAANLKKTNFDAYKAKYANNPTGEYMSSDQLMQYVRDQYDKTDAAVNAYNSAYQPLADKVKQYNDAKSQYVGMLNKVNMDVGQVNRLGAAHQAAIDNLTNSVAKYQTGMVGEAANLEKQAADKAIQEAKDYFAQMQKQKEDAAQQAGFKSVSDMEKAGVMGLAGPDYYARLVGFQTAADQAAAKGADAKTYYMGLAQQKQAEAAGFKTYADFTAAKGAKASDYYALQDAVNKGFKTVADMNAAAAKNQTAAQFYAPPVVTPTPAPAPAPTTTPTTTPSPLTAVAQNPPTTAPTATTPTTTTPTTPAPTTTPTTPTTTAPVTTTPTTTAPVPSQQTAIQKATEQATKLGFKSLNDFMAAMAARQTATQFYAPKTTTAAAPVTSTVVPATK